mmetsp:Transcript_92429/g.128307  ORF Transcript_92429/g.128307 Transcript_92429/m.128307 type:complete len:81 (+) Transcript_92429:1001-1243(+)
MMRKGEQFKITNFASENIYEIATCHLFTLTKKSKCKGLKKLFKPTVTRYGYFYGDAFIVFEKLKKDMYKIKSRTELTRLF